MRLMPKPFATEEHTRRCCVSTVTCIHVDTRLVAGRGDAAKCRSASGTYSRCFLPESTFAARRTLSCMHMMPKPLEEREHTRRCWVSTVTCIHVDTRQVAGCGDAAKCRSASGTYISAETPCTGVTTLSLRLPTASRHRLHLCYPAVAREGVAGEWGQKNERRNAIARNAPATILLPPFFCPAPHRELSS